MTGVNNPRPASRPAFANDSTRATPFSSSFEATQLRLTMPANAQHKCKCIIKTIGMTRSALANKQQPF